MKDILQYERHLKPYACSLRKNMTKAEAKLWDRIRRKQLQGAQFYRQKPVGEFIVDFFCPKAKLVIELDGGQHYSAEGIVKDERRDALLKKKGLRVIRFSDKDVFEKLEAVLEQIYGCLSKSPLTPLCKRGEEEISPDPSLRKRGSR